MKLKMSVDKIEGYIAVLLIRPAEKNKLCWPLDYLPENVKEGDILSITIEVDTKEAEKAKQRVKNLLDQLKENP